MSAAAILLYAVVFGIVLGTALILARRGERRLVTVLVLVGLAVSAGKIGLFQQAPQWHDTNPDSITYDLNARALALHWAGEDVPAEDYRLRGLDAHQKPVWTTEERFTYGQVHGSSDWLYVGYVAVWYALAGADQDVAIFSNAALAAFSPAAAFGIALALGASRKLALGAAMIALVDPSSGINASWLLKDTLVGFLAMAALWAAVVYARDRRGRFLIVLAIAVGLLGATRFVAFGALLIALAIWSVWALRRLEYAPSIAMIAVIVVALLLRAWLVSLPQSAVSTEAAVSGVVLTAQAGLETLKATRGAENADETVLRWKDALQENPLLAITKSVAHTLFAPYPWVAAHPGLTWKSFSELYYPGVVLWMAMLPGVAFAIAHFARRRDQGAWIVLVFLAVLLAAYTVFLGEWSTRQRVFALPAFFAIGAIGWSLLIAKYKTRRRSA